MLVGIVGCGGFGREIMPIVRETLDRARTNARLVFVEGRPPERRERFPVMSNNSFSPPTRTQFNIGMADFRVEERSPGGFMEAGAPGRWLCAASARQSMRRTTLGEGWNRAQQHGERTRQ